MTLGEKVYILEDKVYGKIGFIGNLKGETIYRVDTEEYSAWYFEDELVVVKK